ncbi:MAG: sterol desaturase/sphingolipid hydroxylase (fatty acid hydroxylase superfamily) [Alcanivorax sp.]|jgi:sterol desaturase/sphingolipid hydroxylase (fatty acid hydroxylase superfamily)
MIETAPNFHLDLIAITLLALVVGMLLEMVRPARDIPVSLTRWLNNGSLALIAYAINYVFATLIGLYILYRFESPDLLGLSSAPLWLNLLVTFLVVEGARYSIHVAVHKVDWLWRFHSVHHSDAEVDLSTSFRHHPVKGMLNAIPMTALIWLIASGPQALILYRAWDLVSTVLTHTNVDIPHKIERWLRFAMVTPAFHRTHHFAEKRFTDSNYSATIPWFDYLFSTYQPTTVERQTSAKIGLDTHTVNEQRLDGMILAPFLNNIKEPDLKK